MAARWQAVKPDRPILDFASLILGVNAEMKRFQAAAQRKMQTYPPAQPWRHPPPRSGPRRANPGSMIGRRTGDYGRGWHGRVYQEGADLVAEIANGAVDYGIYVGGPREGPGPGTRQAWFMGPRGWTSVTEVDEDWGRTTEELQRIIDRAAT